MNNLKKPLFLAFAVLVIYWIILALFTLAIGPYTKLENIPFVILILLESVLLVVSARSPFPAIPNSNYLKYFPLFFGIFASCCGSLVIYLDPELFSVSQYDSPWHAFTILQGAALLPVGLLMIIFSAINLILEKRKQQVQGQAAPSK